MTVLIEILAYDVATLYGENGHQLMLKECFKDHTVMMTSLVSEPAFVKESVDFIYLGTMTEKYQQILLSQLRPYTQRLKEMLEEGVFFLVCGNGLDIFGEWIEYDDGLRVEGLHLFDFTTTQKYRPRLNCFILGEYQGLKLVGHKSQFTQSYYKEGAEQLSFFDVSNGFGLNVKTKKEGIHYKNFYGTNCIGPFLLLNPLFLKALLEQLPQPTSLAKGYDALLKAYNQRLIEFESGEFKQIMGEL